jgi:hypothetical protein
LDLRQELLKGAQLETAEGTPSSAVEADENRNLGEEVGATDLLASCVAQGEWREFGANLDCFLEVESGDDVGFCFED